MSKLQDEVGLKYLYCIKLNPVGFSYISVSRLMQFSVIDFRQLKM